MMTQEEMREQYAELYDIMASSRKVENMRLFGSVMSDMIEWLIDNKPEIAQRYIERLSAVKWRNYLTTKEADNILASMTPKPIWTREEWVKAMDKLGLDTNDEPDYNWNALFVTMSMVYSDSARTIAKLLGKPLDEVDNEDMIVATYNLAVDKLTDEDGRFNVRLYFGL